MNVTVIGTGYVGLVTGACLSDVGNHVLCVDKDQAKVDLLKQGGIPIHEPGLAPMVEENISKGRLEFTTDLDAGIRHGQILFIAVGTPPDEDGSADLQHVLAVAKGIGTAMDAYRVIVTKSTVPVGTAEKVTTTIQGELDQRDVQHSFSVVSNPEFLKEGAAIEDFIKPDRIVIGAEDVRAQELMRHLYSPFNRNHDRVIMMDVRSAELTKYAANALLATKISFMNELANLAEKLGADIETVRQGIGSDPRIGYQFIYPGCGYGGSCFPKDVKALYQTANQNGYQARILSAVEEVNEQQKKILAHKVIDRFGKDLSGFRFAVWGLAFKPDTDDMRDAPSRTIMEILWEHGAQILAYDPVANDEARRIYGERKDLLLTKDSYDALDEVDALLIVTEWKLFRTPDLPEMSRRMKRQVVFDGRNIFDPSELREAGFEYYGIGR